MTIEEHINGLKGIKPYLQKKMLEINYEGLGELDALQVGETMDFAIESIKELETYKKELVVLRKAYELSCEFICANLPTPSDTVIRDGMVIEDYFLKQAQGQNDGKEV